MSARVLSGIDLVEIARFRALNPAIRARFYQRVFTQEERTYAGASLQRAAGLFAAKEAAVKALGCGIGPVSKCACGTTPAACPAWTCRAPQPHWRIRRVSPAGR